MEIAFGELQLSEPNLLFSANFEIFVHVLRVWGPSGWPKRILQLLCGKVKELEPSMQGLSDWMRRAHAGAETPDRPNHYKELGLRCDCDADEVKKKFRLLLSWCQPRVHHT